MALSSNFTHPTETVLSAPATPPTAASPDTVRQFADYTSREGTSPGPKVDGSTSSQTMRDVLLNILMQFGMEGLVDTIMPALIESTDPTTLLLQIRATPQYKARFPAMEELQRKARENNGRGYSEGDYIEIENAYRRVFSESGLPPDMWDSADDFAELMKKEVNAPEVQRRVDMAKKAVLSTDPSTREQLLRLYGIGTTDLMAYALRPDWGSERLDKIATTAIMAGMGSDAGLGTGLGAAQWERYAGEAIQANTGFGEVRGQIAAASGLAREQRRLAGIEGQSFTDTDALDVAILQDAQKGMASAERAKRERARFSGSSGISGGTLRGSSAL